MKKLVFGFIAVFIIPALFFLLLELGLKVLGTGKNFDYFTKIELNGQDYYQDNPVFIQQFYPASLDIIPLENTFSAKADTNRVRVFVLGGSAARGFPNPAHGFSRHLETLLREALPGKKVEVINTAMTAINSHVVYETARSIPDGSADFAIVLMGNNEVIGPYGPGTYNQNFLSNLGMIRLLQSVRRSHIGQLMSDLAASANPRDHKEELKWKGMQMFTEESVPADDPRLETVYDHYLHNLQDTVSILQRKGAHVILSSVPVNLRDSAPFSSVHKPDLSQQRLELWQSTVNRAHSGFEQRKWREAISDYEAALAIDPGYADTHFRLAISYDNISDFKKASEHFNRARDLDALRFRADSRINQIIRHVAAESAGTQLSLVDNESAFSQQSQPQQPGWDLFLEHVHYNFSGDYLLAREFSGSILQILGVDDYQPISENEIAARIGYPSNMTIKVLDRVVSMVKSPPFTGQSNQAELEQLIVTMRRDVEGQLGPVSDQINRRQKVLQSGKGDWRLRYELAHLYEHMENRPATYQQLLRLHSEYPYHHDSLVMLAKMLHQDKKYRQEIPYLQLALKHARGEAKTIAQLTGWLGLTYFRLGENELAADHLLDVARNYPEQTHYALQAYATLIKYSIQSGNTRDADDYVDEVQRYAKRAVSAGRDRDYPLLYSKMSQIMRLAGDEVEAGKWKQRSPRRPSERPAANS